MNGEASRLIDQFKRAHDGDPWHGSPLKGILEGVTAAQAAAQPAGGAHSIWELVLHITAWRNEVAARAGGKPAGTPAAGDFPPVGEPTTVRWQAALAALDTSHQNLVTAVGGMSDDRMWTPTDDPRNPPPGIGDTYYETLHGIVQHDAYHAGQIALLKKLFGV
jgi:uncharacterized damage-inducible protein DinB